jgi:hypothetical protein
MKKWARIVIGGNFKGPSIKLTDSDIITNGQAVTVKGVIILFSLFISTIVKVRIVRKKIRLGN